MWIFLEKSFRRGKHLLIMLCDFFKNSNIESCFSMAISAYLSTVKYPNECSVITEWIWNLLCIVYLIWCHIFLYYTVRFFFLRRLIGSIQLLVTGSIASTTITLGHALGFLKSRISVFKNGNENSHNKFSWKEKGDRDS